MPSSIWHRVEAKRLTKAIYVIVSFFFAFRSVDSREKTSMMFPSSGKNYNTLDNLYDIVVIDLLKLHHYFRSKEYVAVNVSRFQFGNLHGFVEISVAK